MKKEISIIGFGNMGRAIAQQLKKDYSIYVFDKDSDKTGDFSGLNLAKSCADLVNKADKIILAIKPQDFTCVLEEIKGCLEGKLIISIAAGIPTGYIEQVLGGVGVVRVMPNMPAKIGAGMSCLSKGSLASEEDLNFTKNLFAYMGEVLVIKEALMNAATAVSGSGPAYVCKFIESESIDLSNIPEEKKSNFLNSFQEAAQDLGFATEEAKILVNVTFTGTIGFLKKSNLLPSELKKQVASKGGTTEAALAVLDRGGTLKEAVRAAEEKAKQLSRG